ncbi:MAG: thiosulfate dehydrogenase (quinone) large subunit [Chloroflexota bacterium]|jgi:thiosulfate dehydrogenase [quinone] large subunit|nr:thiosulfate dehydrogenase (quinone) large subunit [Chloroflexota bacterium]
MVVAAQTEPLAQTVPLEANSMSTLRRWAIPIAAVAAVLLVYLVNPWIEATEPIRTFVTFGFWGLAILLTIVLFEDRKQAKGTDVEVEGPAFTRFLFNNSRAGLLWLPIRVFVGFAWLEAGLHHFSDPKWMTAGESLRGYWTNAAAIPETGRAAISFEWYRDFINVLLNSHSEGWFAIAITFGEIAVGVALIFGIMTGLSAFFGALMNMSFLLAGSASTNPVLFSLSIGLILAWKVAGYYGFDRYLLPRLGTPWRPGILVQKIAHARGAPA